MNKELNLDALNSLVDELNEANTKVNEYKHELRNCVEEDKAYLMGKKYYYMGVADTLKKVIETLAGKGVIFSGNENKYLHF